jgi:hypothetical protein
MVRGGRTGTGYEVRYTWDEWAHNREVLHPRVSVRDQSSAQAQTVLCLTLGDLQTVRQRGILSEEESKAARYTRLWPFD